MDRKDAYLVIDIGTGNMRVAAAGADGTIYGLVRSDVMYEKDPLYPDALHFDPEHMWEALAAMSERLLRGLPEIRIRAVTTSSQREGIVVLDARGTALTGLPNHDHRGREWASMISDPHRVYTLTGRYPSSLFSALKLMALLERHPEIRGRWNSLLSISDWAAFKLSGVMGYEHSQASETLLYDVEKASWSPELCELFQVPAERLPPLRAAGTVLGPVDPALVRRWGLDENTPVIVGGADTQLAIKSTMPLPGDIVIVSGTTTPVARIVSRYTLDDQERTWTNRHVTEGQFILETNCGVTGLNYQRLKAAFYPRETYEEIEVDLDRIEEPACMASLGTLLADEKTPLTKGGFLFPAPVSAGLTRADFAWAILWDIACSVRENLDSLVSLEDYGEDYVWACGGGMLSPFLTRCIAGLTGKEIRLREGFRQASVTGAALICHEALGGSVAGDAAVTRVMPGDRQRYQRLYEQWKKTREDFRQIGT